MVKGARSKAPVNNRNIDLRSATIFGFVVNLAFYETVLYNSLRFAPSLYQQNKRKFAFEFASYIIAGWVLMVIGFAVNRKNLGQASEALSKRLHWVGRKAKDALLFAASLVVLLLIVWLFFGPILDGPGSRLSDIVITGAREAAMKELLTSTALIVLWILIGLLTFLLSWLARRLGADKAYLRDAVQDWTISIKVSVFYYLLLAAAACRFIVVTPSELGWRFYFDFGKDVILMFIITELLYVSLYKLALHKCLLAVFQNQRGFIEFLVICAIIAIIAVGADFNWLMSKEVEGLSDFQKRLAWFHVFVRDIGLLLLPIGLFVVWVMTKVSEEMAATHKGGRARRYARRNIHEKEEVGG